MLKFSKMIPSKSKNIVKEKIESLKIFQILFIIQWMCWNGYYGL
jgi:hypothetical protein